MHRKTISVPNSAVIRQARNVLSLSDWRLDRGQAVIRFHPAYCHMQPWVLATLAAWAQEYRRTGGSITVENPEKGAYSFRFGLAEYIGILNPTPVTEHEEAGRFVPLRTIRTSDDLSDLLARLVTLLHLSDEPEHAKAVLYAMSEMVRNTLEHSEADNGAVVAAQLYAGSRTSRRYVSIGIADCGVGVRQTIKRNYPNIQWHSQALLKAIQPGATGAVQGEFGSADNAGAGLFITRRVSAATRGYFGIASGNAMFRSSLATRPPSEESSVFETSFFPGTIVCVEIGLEQNADFSEILSLARESFGGMSQRRRTDLEGKVRFT